MALVLSTNREHSSMDSDLAKQTCNKMSLQTAVAESCRNSIATIKRSQKLIDINADFQRMTKEEALEKMRTHIHEGEDTELKFRDLKMFDDIYKSYEAEPIIKHAFDLNKGVSVSFEFEGIRKEEAIELLPAFKRHRKEIPK